MWLGDYWRAYRTCSSHKEKLAYYGEISLSNIKAHAVSMNTNNDRKDQEDNQIYMCLME